MKRKGIALCTMALLIAAGCAKQDKKPAGEVNEKGIPVAVADIMLSDSCSIDTLYANGDDVYMLIDDTDYMQKIIFDRNGVIVNNPVLTVDSLTPTSYRVSDLISSTVVDFAIEENVDALRALYPVYDDFRTVTMGSAETGRVNTLFSFAVSEPGDKVKNHADISRWVAAGIDTVAFDGSFARMAATMSADFNKEMAEYSDGAQFELYDMHSSLVYWKTADYVTYFDMSAGFTGGAHGIYGYTFPTYLISANKPLTFEYMFRPEAANDIRNLIYESLLADADFATNHNINSVSQLRNYVEANLMGQPLPLPAPGLLANGAVFCYQPYEIASYADGSFQLVVPYAKLKPYMTDAGMKLVP